MFSMQLLGIERSEKFTKEKLMQDVMALCSLNDCFNSARIRLAVYRDENNTAGYLMEALPLNETVNRWQEGLVLTLYPLARKSTDAFSNLKSANFLPYVLAQKFAEERNVDDAIVMNIHNRICDTSKANIFIVKNNEIFTPALREGCVNGIMRGVVIEEVKKLGYALHQDALSEEQLLAADEVFLTNAMQIIRHVSQYKTATYGFTTTKKIFDTVCKTLFTP